MTKLMMTQPCMLLSLILCTLLTQDVFLFLTQMITFWLIARDAVMGFVEGMSRCWSLKEFNQVLMFVYLEFTALFSSMYTLAGSRWKLCDSFQLILMSIVFRETFKVHSAESRDKVETISLHSVIVLTLSIMLLIESILMELVQVIIVKSVLSFLFMLEFPIMWNNW